MDWPQAMAWVPTLVLGGYNDWRLPKAALVDSGCTSQYAVGAAGFNCTAGELSHLFYIGLGGKAGVSIAKAHNENFSLFKNIEAAVVLPGVETGVYWTNTEFVIPLIAWHFQMRNGYQNANSKSAQLVPWPVRDGDVAAATRITET